MPDYVQINYERVLSDGLPGTSADANPTYDASYINAGEALIPYGRAISKATASLTGTLKPVMPATVMAKLGGDAIIGITLRSVTDEAQPSPNSGETGVAIEDIGAFRMDGTIKAIAAEKVTAGAKVYADKTTGMLYGTAADSRVAVGTSVWMNDAEQNTIGIIDIRGLR